MGEQLPKFLSNVLNARQLVAASNLSDLASAATARTNLGLGALATQNAARWDQLSGGVAGAIPFDNSLTFGNLGGVGGDIAISAGQVSFGSRLLTDVSDPFSAQDAATKNYTDTGLTYVNPLTTIGDSAYAGAGGVPTRLAGNATGTGKFLRSLGTGSAAQAPSWVQPAFSDLSGTVAAAQLIAPTATTFGGVRSLAATGSQYLTGLGTDGVFTRATVTVPTVADSAVSVGLTRSVGTATTFKRSDASDPLDTAAAYVFTAKQTVRLTTTQSEIGYDSSNKWTDTVNSTGGRTLLGAGTGGSLTITPTAGQSIIIGNAGAASAPAMKLTGTPFTGTGTTSFPLAYWNDANATAPTTLPTAGTYIGVNGHGTANHIWTGTDGVQKFSVDSGGNVNAALGITALGICSAAQFQPLGTSSALVLDNKARGTVLANGGVWVTNTWSNSTGVANPFAITPTYNQTSTASSVDQTITRTETALGSGTHYFQLFKAGTLGTTQKYSLDNAGNGVFAGNLTFGGTFTTTATSGSNAAGTDSYWNFSASTGTGKGGKGYVRGTPAGTTGSSANSFVNYVVIDPDTNDSNMPAIGSPAQVSITNAQLYVDCGTFKGAHYISTNSAGDNTSYFWNKSTGGYSAIAFLKYDGHERSALGYGNPSAALTADIAFYELSSMAAENAGVAPAWWAIHSTDYGSAGGSAGYRQNYRFGIETDGTFKINSTVATGATNVTALSLSPGASGTWAFANSVGITGIRDTQQLIVRGYSTQASNTVSVRRSNDIEVASIDNDGNFRSGASVLIDGTIVAGFASIGDSLSVGNKIKIANASSATVAVGTLANKFPIYDASGVLLGYVPLYASIS